jgi:hypothetical protein
MGIGGTRSQRPGVIPGSLLKIICLLAGQTQVENRFVQVRIDFQGPVEILDCRSRIVGFQPAEGAQRKRFGIGRQGFDRWVQQLDCAVEISGLQAKPAFAGKICGAHRPIAFLVVGGEANPIAAKSTNVR